MPALFYLWAMSQECFRHCALCGRIWQSEFPLFLTMAAPDAGLMFCREPGYRTPALPHLNCRIPLRVHSDDGDERFFVLARESPSRDFLAAVGV